MIQNFSRQKLELLYWGIKETGIWNNPNALNFLPELTLEKANPAIHGHLILFQIEQQLYGMKKNLIETHKLDRRWKSQTKKLLETWLADMDGDSRGLLVCFFKRFDQPNSKWKLYIENTELRTYLKQIVEKKEKGLIRRTKSYFDVNFQGEDYPILPFIYEHYPKWYNENYEREEKFEQKGGEFGEFIRVYFWLFAIALSFVFLWTWFNS